MRRQVTRSIRSARAAAAVAVLLAVTGCSQSRDVPTPSASSSALPTLRVLADPTTPSRILANLYAGALNATGRPARVEETPTFDDGVRALEKGGAAVVGGGAGSLADVLNRQVNGPNAEPVSSANLDETMRTVRDLGKRLRVTVLDPAEAGTTRVFAVTKAFAKSNGIVTLSDLAGYGRGQAVVLAGPPECRTRQYCLPGLTDTYGMNVAAVRGLDDGGPLTLAAVRRGTATVGMFKQSDGALDPAGLVILVDDRNLEQPENVVVAVSDRVARPAVTDPLNRVQSRLTTKAFQDLNYAVTALGESPSTAADAWLVANGVG